MENTEGSLFQYYLTHHCKFGIKVKEINYNKFLYVMKFQMYCAEIQTFSFFIFFVPHRTMITLSNKQVGKTTTLKKCKLHKNNRLLSSRAIQWHLYNNEHIENQTASLQNYQRYLLHSCSSYIFKIYRNFRHWNSSHVFNITQKKYSGSDLLKCIGLPWIAKAYNNSKSRSSHNSCTTNETRQVHSMA